MFYLYILYSESFDKYYIGYTDNTVKRLEEHNTSSHNTYTSKHRPWILKATFEVGEIRALAMKIESKIKSLKSRKIIKDLIVHNGDTEYLKKLVRVPTCRD